MGIEDGMRVGADPNLPPPVTMASALRSAAQSVGNKPLDPSDASAIQSAESRASSGVLPKGGVGATAQSVVDKGDAATVGDVLNRRLPMGGNKIVTKEDAAHVQSAEQRNNPANVLTPGGVAASVQSAADTNKAAGYT